MVFEFLSIKDQVGLFFVLNGLLSMLFIFVPIILVLSFLERKTVADFQARVGPNQTLFSGLFQAIADSMKLLQKKRKVPFSLGSQSWMFLKVGSLFVVFYVVPIDQNFNYFHSDLGPLIAVAFFVLYSVSGIKDLSNHDAYLKLLPFFRATSQTLSALVPILIALLGVGVVVGGMSWSEILRAQDSMNWLVFQNPLLLFVFLSFFVSGFILVRVAPFSGDLVESQSLLRGLAGPDLGLTILCQKISEFLWVALTVAIFCGAGLIPERLAAILGNTGWNSVTHAVVFLFFSLKVGLLWMTAKWIGRLVPTYRVDQVTDLIWKVLVPVTLGAVMLMIGWVALVE